MCGWSVWRSRSYRDEKNKEMQEFKLRYAQGTPSKYFKDTQASKLGDAPVGIPSFFFNNYRYTLVFVLFTWYASFVFIFLFFFPLWIMLVWDSPSLTCRMLFVLHLNLLSMALQNALCASLKYFEYGFIECFVCFIYIFWAWIFVNLY